MGYPFPRSQVPASNCSLQMALPVPLSKAARKPAPANTHSKPVFTKGSGISRISPASGLLLLFLVRIEIESATRTYTNTRRRHLGILKTAPDHPSVLLSKGGCSGQPLPTSLLLMISERRMDSFVPMRILAPFFRSNSTASSP